MRAGQLEVVIRHLRKVTSQCSDTLVGDAELLERFIAHHDDGAFELLVRRHGPMVFGVCKRVLGNEADAEDAFQATFLVLVRKAASIIPRTRVGNWLHGVAHKTAIKARAMNARRRVKEREATSQGRKASDDAHESLLEILDDELRTLPAKYQTPIILCDLEGLSYREAAARLRCPLGTLSGRLTRARALLARRIARRGQTVTTAALASLLVRDASASVPASLMVRIIRVGTLLAVGKKSTGGMMSAKVASLVEGVLKMLLLSKLKAVTGKFLLLAVFVAAGWTCAAWVSARAALPGEELVTQTQENTRAPAGQVRLPTDSREAEFDFRGADKRRNNVSLLIAGTSVPVLCLPLGENHRVLRDGREVGIDTLQLGARVAIRLDATNSVIQEIRVLERPDKVTALKNASDLAQLAPPSTGEVLRALSNGGTIATVLKVSRDDINIQTEQLVRQVDPARFFPLVGEAQLHHCHWKCTVYYTEIAQSDDPIPVLIKRPRVEVVYIDKDYLVPVKGAIQPPAHPAVHEACIAASVNGKSILAGEVYAAAYLSLPNAHALTPSDCSRRITAVWRKTLERVIERELILQQAFTRLKPGNANLMEKLQEAAAKEFGRRWVKTATGSGVPTIDKELRASLREQGTSLEEVRRQWERNFIAEEYLRNQMLRVGDHTEAPSDEAARQQRARIIAKLKRQAVIEYGGGGQEEGRR
jgi:RNA polymerase sigma factor (sigma-70 family)